MDFCTNCVNEYAWRPTNNPFPKECKECEVIDGKPSKFKPKNKTNADRIRAMSDDELAEFIFEAPAVPCDMKISAMMKENSCNDCASCIMEWLKQPAEDTP